MSVFVRRSHYDEEQNKEYFTWDKEFDSFVWDFPGIEVLFNGINALVNNEIPLDEYMTVKYKNDDEMKAYTIFNDDFFCEDIYIITKMYLNKEIKEEDAAYSIQFGTVDNGVTKMIKVSCLNKDNVCEIRDMALAFVDMSIEIYNELMEKEYERRSKNKYAIDKVFVVDEDFNNGGTEFYVIDDIVELHYIENDKKIEIFNATITNITDEGICVLYDKDKKLSIKYADIYAVYTDLDNDKKLNYNEEEVAADFIETILNNSPKLLEEFKTDSIELLVEKYGDIIIDRTWMCRDEHPFNRNRPQNSNYVEYAKNIISKKIIPIIKNLLKNNS
jgi:predicted metal-binding transcription factor (methanogenesis marker protein 9)